MSDWTRRPGRLIVVRVRGVQISATRNPEWWRWSVWSDRWSDREGSIAFTAILAGPLLVFVHRVLDSDEPRRRDR